MNKFKRNLSYSLLSNLITLLTSLIMVVLMPKFLGIEEYGYWQLYLLYVSYVGFLHLGWSDGVYLRYGGQDYTSLKPSMVKQQLISLGILELFLGIIFISFTGAMEDDTGKLFVFVLLGINIFIMNVSSFIILLLQATNKIKESALMSIIGRLFFILTILFILLFKFTNFELLIIADSIGKLISMILGIYFIRNKLTSRYVVNKEMFREIKVNIKVGISLMFSNIANLLIIGVVMLGIENNWDIKIFGQIALIISITNLFLVFINAIGIVLFPIIKGVKKEFQAVTYILLRNIVMPMLISFLILYYPISVIVKFWLPEYMATAKYLGLLFPIFIFESKMGLMINVYMKALRKERLLFAFNFIVLILSCIFVAIIVNSSNNILYMIMLILIILGFRSTVLEITLFKILGIFNYKVVIKIVTELVIIAVTIYINHLELGVLGFVYLVFIIFVYLLMNAKTIINSLKGIRTVPK